LRGFGYGSKCDVFVSVCGAVIGPMVFQILGPGGIRAMSSGVFNVAMRLGVRLFTTVYSYILLILVMHHVITSICSG
jgi:hypothetical protein